MRCWKHSIALLIVVFTLSAALAGCTQKTEEFTLQELMEKNTIDALADSYGGYTKTFTDYSKDGEEIFTVMESLRVTDSGDVLNNSYSDGYVEYIEDDIGYVYWGDGKESVHYYMDGARISKLLMTALYNENERLISHEKKDGKYFVVTEIDWADMPDAEKGEMEQTHGITDGVFVYEYLVEESLFIASVETFHKSPGGQTTLLSKTVVEKGGLTGAPDTLSALMNPAETRTTTLVFNPNTDSEETQSFTFKKDAVFSLITEREYTMYDDKACTVKSSSAPEKVDKTVYVVFEG